jgi:DnaJ-class molecular chaperone
VTTTEGLTVAWNKRGANQGGNSTGRDGAKRGGRNYTADTDHPRDRGTLTCPTCLGSGQVDRPLVEGDEDGAFAGAGRDDCAACDGTGKVNKK